jgi:hypothetical protein
MTTHFVNNIKKSRRFVKHNKTKKTDFLLPQKLDNLTQTIEGLTASLSTISNTIAYNANRYMTLAAGDRAMRSIDPRRQCAGAKPRRGRKPERGFAEAEPPTGGVQLQSC